MSEVIVLMGVPTVCANCPMADDDSRFCKAAKEYIPMLGKPSWCPIGELPEHGDLIDRDELKKHKRHSEEFCENIVSVAHIDWMPTIVPATERSET